MKLPSTAIATVVAAAATTNSNAFVVPSASISIRSATHTVAFSSTIASSRATQQESSANYIKASALEKVQQWSATSPVIDAAFDVLCDGGVILYPTNVGYSLITLDGKEGAAKLDQVKGREKKPYGVLGTETTFSRVFSGRKAPALQNDFCSDTCLSFVSSESVSDDAREQLKMSRAVGPVGEVAMWINIGPIFDTLVERVEEKYEGKRLVLITSGNISRRGNPASSTFSTTALDDELLDRVDLTIDVPHWSDPELDEDGRWYSAPMFDMDSCTFRRVGKNMDNNANIVVSLFHDIDEDGSRTIDLDEFRTFFKSGRVGEELASLPDKEIETMFHLIDEDGSGGIDFEEMYDFLASNKSTKFNIATCTPSASSLPL